MIIAKIRKEGVMENIKIDETVNAICDYVIEILKDTTTDCESASLLINSFSELLRTIYGI